MPSNFTTDDETRVAGIQSTISALQGLISDITSQNNSVGIKSYIRETDLNCVISGCEIVKITGTMKVGIQAGADPLSVAYVQGTRFAPENKITASNYGVIVPPTTSTYQRHIVCLNGNGGIQLVTSAPAADYDYDSAFTKDLLPLYLLHVPAYTTLNIDSGSVTLTDIRQYYSRGIRLPSYQYPAGKTFTLTQTHGAYGAGLYLKTVSGWETIPLVSSFFPLSVPNGGTGLATIPSGRILYGNNTSAVSTKANFVFDGNNLGIGTTTPLYELHVSGTIASFGSHRGFLSVGTTTGPTNYEGLSCVHAGSDGGARFISSGIGTGTIRSFNWLTWNGSSATNLMTLTASGNLLLNSAPNLSRLSVKGWVVQWGNNEGFTAVGTGSDLTNYEALTCSHSGAHGARFVTSGVGTGTIRDFRWITWNGSVVTNLMTLTPTANLGLGTTTPSAYLSGTTGMVISTPNSGLAFNDTNTGKTYLLYGSYNNLRLYEPSIPTVIIDINAGGKVLLGVGGGTAAARLHVLDTTGAQAIFGYNDSSFMEWTVASNGAGKIRFSGLGNSLTFEGNTASNATRVFVNNANANAPGAVAGYLTQGTVRGYVGALKHGSASNVLFTGETADGFGIRAESVLEFGIGATRLLRLTSAGLTLDGLSPDYSPALHIIKKAEQLRLGYDTNNYLTMHVYSEGQVDFISSGTNPRWIFYGASTSASHIAKVSIHNNIANARGAITEYTTGNSVKGSVGALKNGSAAEVMFTGETADGFGIKATSVLEMGIGTNIKLRMDWSATRFYNQHLRIDQAPSGTAGAATGTYFRINLNGVYYKIALLAE